MIYNHLLNNLKGACKELHCKDQPHCTEAQIVNNKTTTTTNTTTTSEKPNTEENEDESTFGNIIAGVKRLELEARREKEELKQRVKLAEEKYKILLGDLKKYQQKTEKSLGNQLNKLNNIDMNLRSHERRVKAEFSKRDKSMLYLVSKKFLPYIRSLVSRMDGVDDRLKKMDKEADYFGEASWKA